MLGSVFLAVVGLVGLLAALIVLLQDLQVLPALLDNPDFSEVAEDIEIISLEVEPGVTIQLWALCSDGVPLLFLHGNGDTVVSFADTQRKFAELGFSVVQFDYRGIGASTGWPSERGLYQDAEVALKYLAERHGCSCDEVVLVGQSLGTGPASYLANKYHSKKLLLYTPYTSLPDVVKGRPVLRVLTKCVWYRFPVLDHLKQWIQQQGDRSLIIVHCQDDLVIPFSHAEAIFTELKSCSESAEITFLQYPSGGHAEVIACSSNDVSERLASWV